MKRVISDSRLGYSEGWRNLWFHNMLVGDLWTDKSFFLCVVEVEVIGNMWRQGRPEWGASSTRGAPSPRGARLELSIKTKMKRRLKQKNFKNNLGAGLWDSRNWFFRMKKRKNIKNKLNLGLTVIKKTYKRGFQIWKYVFFFIKYLFSSGNLALKGTRLWH